ncbi:GreA/GreB family elongation factor [Bdellovibrio sp. BCCA]|uniref:GreA/GreB family elongation factor n=1 Tax=Bdellovibrio sp. BCCA TaxID=3136281 RepID=UPI0030F03EB3
MNKKKLIENIRTQLTNDLDVLKQAAKATYEAATHEESKPENEYDTRGLEASYLAGAQAKRIAEIEELLVIFKHVDIKDFGPNDKINSTALVEVESNGKHSFFFIMAKGGGLSISYEGRTIQVITPSSPLGEALQDLKVGGIAVVENGDQFREYEVLNIW